MIGPMLVKECFRWYRDEAPPDQRARLDFVAASLLGRGYLPVVVRAYAQEWVRFLRAFDRRGLPPPVSFYSAEVRRYLRRRFPSGSASRSRGIRVAVRILLEMDERGSFAARMREPDKERSRLFRAQVPAFLDFMAREREVGSCTIRRRRYQLVCFTEFLGQRRVSRWEQVTVRQVRDFLARLKIAAQTRCAYAHCLRGFFRWAFLHEVLPVDISGAIPTVRHYRLARLPNLLTAEEVRRLLRGLDRATVMGRRDYAVLLLAARYGMRPSDIRQLSLDHIDWVHRRIVFEQSKTRRELVLPLLRDVGAALRDYVRHARPRTSSRMIFVRHKAPFEPFCAANTLNQVMRGALAQAGMPRNRKGGSGLSVFRHTLATHLLSSGQPLKTIGDILGHVTSASTLIYTKVDLSTLRTAAISMREVMS